MRSSSTPTTTTALACLGAAYASVQAFKVARFVWRHYLRPPTNLQKRYGSGWAVVTGATSGVGLGCARELASQGFNIVLMARTVKDLESVAQELQDTYKVNTLVVPMDAAKCNERDVEGLVKKLNDKSVAILVNSVGILSERPAVIEDMDFDLAKRIIDVNCSFTVLLTSKLAPLLKMHAHNNGHAAIMNVGSLTSSTPFCYQSTYAATKAFHCHWSRCIAAEMPKVDVLCVRPGLTASRMSGLTESGGMVADADDLAKRALGMLGLSVKQILPFPPHAIMDYLSSIVPEHMQESANRKINLEIQREKDEEAKKKAEEDMDEI